MNRTDRLYAMVEELRAAAPRARTAQHLASHFEVSVRTIERDVLALLEAGVPIWATRGPGGGYTIDPQFTLPPVNFTAPEAAAIAIALSRVGTMPFAGAARTALQKVMAAMDGASAARAHDLVDRVRLLLPRTPELRGVDPAIERAVVSRHVIEFRYRDRAGATTAREVEPFGFVGADEHWYLVGWCRLRNEGRTFRLDRIAGVRVLADIAVERPFEMVSGDIAELVRSPSLFVE